NLVCIATGWTEMRAIRTKARRWVLEALLDIRQALPFPLLGLDCDNGGEFINKELFQYCVKESVTFTRSRPYRKNDNCFIEQKNWPVVRQQVGYLRYDTPEELEVLRKMYGYLRLYMNYFQPQMKLISKTRNGAKVSKKFDLAQTPYQRVVASPQVPEPAKQALTTIYKQLNPAQLKRELIACQDELLKISAKKPRKEVRPPAAQNLGHIWYSKKNEDLLREATGGT
ncbi:MAG: transposase, partial [Acidimicrobiia bacterium]